MTKEEEKLKKDALLIAEFEGYKVEGESLYGSIEYSEDNLRTAIDTYYHKSWDWIIPVVSKLKDSFRGDEQACDDLDFHLLNTDIYGVFN